MIRVTHRQIGAAVVRLVPHFAVGAATTVLMAYLPVLQNGTEFEAVQSSGLGIADGNGSMAIDELDSWNSSRRAWYVIERLRADPTWQASPRHAYACIAAQSAITYQRTDLHMDHRLTTRKDLVARPSWGNARAVIRGEQPDRACGFEYAAGWPWPAFWCECEVPAAPNVPWGAPVVVHGGTMLPPVGNHFPTSPGNVRLLPFRPVWWGLLADVGALSVLSWLVFTASTDGYRFARTLARYRFGRCPICAYDLRHNLACGCPECGWKRDAGATPAAHPSV